LGTAYRQATRPHDVQPYRNESLLRDFNNWQQIQALGDVPHREILVYIAAATEIFGGDSMA